MPQQTIGRPRDERAFSGCHAVLGVRADLLEILLRAGLSVDDVAAIAGVSPRTLQGDLCLRAMLDGGIEDAADLAVQKLRRWEWFVHAIAGDARYRISVGRTDRRFVRDIARSHFSLEQVVELRTDEKRVSLLRHCLEVAARRKVEGARPMYFKGKSRAPQVSDIIRAHRVLEAPKFVFPYFVLTDSAAERLAREPSDKSSFSPSAQDVRAALGVYYRSARLRFVGKAPLDLKKFQRRWKSEPRRNGSLSQLHPLPHTATHLDRKLHSMQSRWIDRERSRLELLLSVLPKCPRSDNAPCT